MLLLSVTVKRFYSDVLYHRENVPRKIKKASTRLRRSGQRPNPCNDWVDESAWDSVTELDKLSAFSGFALSFEQVNVEPEASRDR